MVDHIKGGADSLLLVDMGLGKTAAALTALSDILVEKAKEGKKRRALIVAPREVCHSVWRQEVARWEHLRWLKLGLAAIPNAKARFAAVEGPFHAVLLNYENLKWLMSKYKKGKLPFDYVFFDEIDYLKSPGSKRFTSIRYRLDEFSRRVAMTGSLGSEGLLDIWAPAFIVTKGQDEPHPLDGVQTLGTSYDRFKKTYFVPHSRNQWKLVPNPAINVEERVVRALAPWTYRADAKDWLDMDELTVIDRCFDLPQKVRKLYDDLERDLLVEVESHGWGDDASFEEFPEDSVPDTVRVSRAAVLKNKLRQLTAEFSYVQPENAFGEPEGPRKTVWHSKKPTKLQMLHDLQSELMGKGIVAVYAFKAELERMGDVPYLGSGAKQADRAAWIDAWNRKELPLLALHPQSASHGVNLQHGGHYMVMMSMPWSLERYLQTPARLRRLGQTDPVFLYRLIARDTVDEDVAEALAEKRSVQESVYQRIKERVRARA